MLSRWSGAMGIRATVGPEPCADSGARGHEDTRSGRPVTPQARLQVHRLCPRTEGPLRSALGKHTRRPPGPRSKTTQGSPAGHAGKQKQTGGLPPEMGKSRVSTRRPLVQLKQAKDNTHKSRKENSQTSLAAKPEGGDDPLRV